jgi:hypothetical protein
MGPNANYLVAIIMVVTVALFLVGLVWRLYHGGGPEHRGYDADRE